VREVEMGRKHKRSGLRKVKPTDVPHPATKLLTVSEAAVVLNVSPGTVRRLSDSGALPSVVVRSSASKRLVRIPRVSIDEWIEKQLRERR